MLVRIRSLVAGVVITLGPLPGALAADLFVPSEYATIQAAVDAAAPGDRIRIAAGDYYEQILIMDKTNLTLAGESGEPASVIHAFSGMTAIFANLIPESSDVIPILGMLRSEVLVTNLTFDGAALDDLYPPSRLRGIAVFGSAGRVENCTVKEFRGATGGFARGISTFNPISLGTPILAVSVLNSTFVNNARSILMTGDPAFNPALLRTTFSVEGNHFVGVGPTGSMENIGLLVWAGAAGEVRANTMTAFNYPEASTPTRAAILHRDSQYPTRGFLPMQPVRYEGNTFSNNDDHLVLMGANGSQVVNNIFHGSGPRGPRWGGLDVSGTNIVVENNNFSAVATGIFLFGDDVSLNGRIISAASNVSLNNNWFCEVPTPLSIRSGATDIQDQGSQTCPFRPMLQSISKTGSSATLALRSWHAQPVVLESSTDLRNWSPIYTNIMALPRFEYQDPAAAGLPRRLYRAVQQ